MINREYLVRCYRRVLISAKFTRPFSDWDDSMKLKIGHLSGRSDLDYKGVILFFRTEEHWFLIAIDELVWRTPAGEIARLNLSELASAKIDLRVNREHGYVVGKGFGVITLTLKSGAHHHVELEAGSAAEGMLSVINELLRL